MAKKVVEPEWSSTLPGFEVRSLDPCTVLPPVNENDDHITEKGVAKASGLNLQSFSARFCVMVSIVTLTLPLWDVYIIKEALV